MSPAPMIPIRRYVEWLSRGRRTERIAYVLKEWDLPLPLPGAEWVLDTKFAAADALQSNPALKDLFRSATKNGSAVVVERRE